ncbi:hypothetical protein FQR65_LT09075 [Abscondita terminalis]|nr:hypothetical protein FQR65_LT09075 [Abscondita terminalis]
MNMGSPPGLTSPLNMSLEEKMEVDNRSIYVGNVDYGATAEELEQHFHGCGSINRVTILCNKYDGHPKGFAYIEFGDRDSVQTAMAMDESIFRGRQIKVIRKLCRKGQIDLVCHQLTGHHVDLVSEEEGEEPFSVVTMVDLDLHVDLENCNDCLISTVVYEDLKCIPKYSDSNKCPIEYDCSHIYNRSKDSCHLRGKFYKPGEMPAEEDIASYCEFSTCHCTNNGAFSCVVASDSCAEFWVPDFVKPGCYLSYEQNRCCNAGQKCPPFNETDAKCEVNGIIFKEGQKFEHPQKRCSKCICGKGYNGKFEKPFCEILNCTTELRWSKEINSHCAPLYLNQQDCCPRRWICPPTCTFGSKLMQIGDKYKDGKLECECVIPPYLTCKS